MDHLSQSGISSGEVWRKEKIGETIAAKFLNFHPQNICSEEMPMFIKIVEIIKIEDFHLNSLFDSYSQRYDYYQLNYGSYQRLLFKRTNQDKNSD